MSQTTEQSALLVANRQAAVNLGGLRQDSIANGRLTRRQTSPVNGHALYGCVKRVLHAAVTTMPETRAGGRATRSLDSLFPLRTHSGSQRGRNVL